VTETDTLVLLKQMFLRALGLANRAAQQGNFAGAQKAAKAACDLAGTILRIERLDAAHADDL
jgi:hypothetical protein